MIPYVTNDSGTAASRLSTMCSDTSALVNGRLYFSWIVGLSAQIWCVMVCSSRGKLSKVREAMYSVNSANSSASVDGCPSMVPSEGLLEEPVGLVFFRDLSCLGGFDNLSMRAVENVSWN